MSNLLRIETGNGIYEVKKPGGRLGAKNMILLSKLATTEGMQTVPDLDMNEDPGLIARIKKANEAVAVRRMGEVFEEWAPAILPGIIVSGPFGYEDMPGEDQLAVFLALSSETRVAEDFFRILPDPAS